MSMSGKYADPPMSVNESPVNVMQVDGEDYICLTDMAKSSGQERALFSWIRSKHTISFLGLWEQLHNPNFKLHEFVYFKNNAGENSFNPSVSDWIESTGATGIISKRGRYGGTYAHKDIAFEFGTWLSPEFKLQLITEYQELKIRQEKLASWTVTRTLSSVNYKLHTDAIKEHIIPGLSKGSLGKFVYTDEADMLNRIVFGLNASEWKKQNPILAKSGKNQRDYASTTQLVMLANLESLNSNLIAKGMAREDRMIELAREAKRQYQTFIDLEDINAQNLKRLADEN